MYQWLTALPQLISRICHPNEHVQKLLISILVAIVTEFPRHALWAVVGICKSEIEQRKKIAEDIILKAMKILREKGTRDPNGSHTNDAKALAAAQKLFQELIDLAKQKIDRMPRDKSIPVKISKRAFDECRLLVPRQATLTVALPIDQEEKHNPFPANQDVIERFGSTAQVMSSKEKPKKVHVRCAGNKTYNFLCKRERWTPPPLSSVSRPVFPPSLQLEGGIGIMPSFLSSPLPSFPPSFHPSFPPFFRSFAGITHVSPFHLLLRFSIVTTSNGDLRKDSRMMEFNTVVNRLLQRDPEGRRRKLRLRCIFALSLPPSLGGRRREKGEEGAREMKRRKGVGVVSQVVCEKKLGWWQTLPPSHHE
jgi:hypothetical protein